MTGPPTAIGNHWLIPGHEYYNIASLDPAPGGPGSGPYGGLQFNDPTVLFQQLLLPIGAAPFHFLSITADADMGTYALPSGLTIEAISADVTGGTIGCLSPVCTLTVIDHRIRAPSPRSAVAG